jgi:hypothetical protein
MNFLPDGDSSALGRISYIKRALLWSPSWPATTICDQDNVPNCLWFWGSSLIGTMMWLCVCKVGGRSLRLRFQGTGGALLDGKVGNWRSDVSETSLLIASVSPYSMGHSNALPSWTQWGEGR